NISLINRRHYLPRLLPILSSKKQMQKPPQRFEDVDRVTPYQGKAAARGQELSGLNHPSIILHSLPQNSCDDRCDAVFGALQ
ncbi:MAG: hypothetical protein WA555_10540, partial [Candidatus Sulfotelmatobacter sp.]